MEIALLGDIVLPQLVASSFLRRPLSEEPVDSFRFFLVLGHI